MIFDVAFQYKNKRYETFLATITCANHHSVRPTRKRRKMISKLACSLRKTKSGSTYLILPYVTQLRAFFRPSQYLSTIVVWGTGEGGYWLINCPPPKKKENETDHPRKELLSSNQGDESIYRYAGWLTMPLFDFLCQINSIIWIARQHSIWHFATNVYYLARLAS